MKIIHISDTHFGNLNGVHDEESLKGAFLQRKELFEDPQTYLIVSGDISFRGELVGYDSARNFFNATWLSQNGSRERFLACPGNHDICSRSFQEFDKFQYAIRRNGDLRFEEKPAILHFDGANGFLVINTAYHLDHGFGLVDNDYILALLDRNSGRLADAENRIVVLHHHLIGMQMKDISTVRNANRLLAIIDMFGFDLILHGHQHQEVEINIGKSQMQIFSARSLNFSTQGYANGISVLTLGNGIWSKESLVLTADATPVGGAGLKRLL